MAVQSNRGEYYICFLGPAGMKAIVNLHHGCFPLVVVQAGVTPRVQRNQQDECIGSLLSINEAVSASLTPGWQQWYGRTAIFPREVTLARMASLLFLRFARGTKIYNLCLFS